VTHFTPWTALAGGVLIGASAVLLLWLNGRIAGISGIVGGLLSGASDRVWRLLFIAGLVLGAGIWFFVHGSATAPRSGFPVSALMIAGLLVGYGTSLAGGCTSGHGVCGIARLSPRSLVATAVFLMTALVTTFVVRHVLNIA
jgi:uncharacterized membrane protein YedE/YeeE